MIILLDKQKMPAECASRSSLSNFLHFLTWTAYVHSILICVLAVKFIIRKYIVFFPTIDSKEILKP